MRIEELSIGDWVCAKLAKWESDDADMTPPLQIKAIYGIERHNLYVDLFNPTTNTIEHSAFVEDLVPIPLTPEILEKNGFANPCKKDDDYCATLFCSPIPSKNSHIGDFAETWIHKECCEIKIFTSAKPKRLYPQYDYDFILEHYGFQYVHQLQHLLRLMGIEKEIEV